MASFTVRHAPEVDRARDRLRRTDPRRLEKLTRALAKLATDPKHPGLHTHKYEGVTGPRGEQVWQSYVENKTPAAWRIWWVYGPNTGEIYVLKVGPHP